MLARYFTERKSENDVDIARCICDVLGTIYRYNLYVFHAYHNISNFSSFSSFTVISLILLLYNKSIKKRFAHNSLSICTHKYLISPQTRWAFLRNQSNQGLICVK